MGRPEVPRPTGDRLSSLEFSDWATDILRRSHEAARRFNPDATVRVFRGGSGVRFELTDHPQPGDRTLDDRGFVLYVEDGIEGLVDVVEPHDQLVLKPLGSAPNPREHHA